MELLRLFLPVLFPSWRFFAEIGASPRVEFWADGAWRSATSRPVSIPVTEAIVRLFWNADWNEKLYLVSIAERFLLEHEPRLSDEIARRVALRHAIPDPPRIRLILVTVDGRETVFDSNDA